MPGGSQSDVSPDAPTRRTRVMIVAAGLHIGGAEVVIQHLVQALDRRRFDVTVCCIKNLGAIGEQLRKQGVDIVTLAEPNTRRVDYFTFRKLLKLIRDRDSDVVHTHTTDALADAAVCRMLRRSLRLVHTFHYGNYPHADRQKMRIERVAARFADQLVAVGDVQRGQIISTYGLREEAVTRVWNGVPAVPWTTDGSFHRRFGKSGQILVGTIATLIPQKGLYDLLAVARNLRQAGAPVRFVVLGDGQLRGELESARDSMELQDSVCFAGWVNDASRTAMPDLDIFFQPSHWEAMSVAVLEAMAAGRAVLATRVGENARVIEDGVDGLLVHPTDVEGMTAALAGLAADPGLRERLGKEAARKVAARFTVDGMAREYERIYLRLATSGN